MFWTAVFADVARGGCNVTNYVLDWDDVFASGNGPSNVSIGTVDLSFSTTAASGGAPTSQSSTVSNDRFGNSTDGHLLLEMTASAPGEGFVQTISFDETGFPNQGVRDVSFMLLDVDQNTWQDQVQIIAYDLSGNPLPASSITLTPSGPAASATGDIAEGQANADDAQDIGNVAVAIDGEIGRIDIVYTAGPDVSAGLTTQEIGIGQISFMSDVVYDDSDGADDGVVTGNDEDNIIFGSTIADGGLPGSAGDVDPTTPDDLINAGGGNDTVFGGAGNDTINGGEGNDNLRGGDGNNVTNGDGGNDIILGGSQMETLNGGGDDDIILGGGGTDLISGNGGNDEIILGAQEAGGIAFADGGADNDTLTIGFGTSATPVVADIRGVTYQNFEFLSFDAGNTDATLKLLDKQILQFDVIFFDSIGNNSEVVEVTMDSLSTLDLSGLQPNQDDGDFIQVIGEGRAENIIGTFQRDLLQGNGGNDSLTGGAGDDTLEGGTGLDTLIGGRGNDSLDGGSENDSVLGDMGDDTIVAAVNVSGLTATYDGGEDDDTLLLQGNQFFLQDAILRDIETLAFDSDVITRVNLRSDQLEAFDEVTTEAGRVVSHGVEAFLGDNTTADFSAITFTNFDQAFDSVFIRGDRDDETITGSQINDIISSSSGDDSISGQDGNDTVLAGQGRDTFFGGEGNDALNFSQVPVSGVRVDDNGDGTAFKIFASSLPTGQETFESVETFIGGGFGSDADSITLETAINAADVGTQIQGLSDGASGRFISFDGTITQFGLSADYLLSDILNGTAPAGGLPVVGPAGEYEILAGDADGQIGNISFSQFENIRFTVVDPDGVVTGEASAQFMGLGFTDLEGDMITAGDDVIDGVSGTDTIEADAGNDTIIAGDSGTQIDGGEGRDTYDASDQSRIQFLNVTDDGDGGLRKENLAGQPSNDSISNVEEYIAPDGPGSFDTITLRTAVQQSDIGTAIQDLSDDAAGTFTDADGNSIAFGPGEGYLLSDILTGTAPAGLPTVGPVGSYEVGSGDESGQVGNISFENFERIIFTVEASPDGVVDGANTAEDMNAGFDDLGAATGLGPYTDLGGDQIDGADGLNDTILGNGGNDTIDGGQGDDLIDGGAGDDLFQLKDGVRNGSTVDRGVDNDTIIGGETDETDGDVIETDFGAQPLTLTYTDAESGTIMDGTGTVSFEEIELVQLGNGRDTVIGSDEGENVDAGSGNDALNLGGGNDTYISSLGDDTIDGEDGTDTYDFSRSGTGLIDRIRVFVDKDGNGTVDQFSSITSSRLYTDTITSVENFIGGTSGREDLDFTETVEVGDISRDTAGATGSYVQPGLASVQFGPGEDYSLDDILAGTSPDGVLPAIGPVGDYQISSDGVQIGSVSATSFDTITFSLVSTPDGVVDGANTAQNMTLGFVDADGDAITENADTILGNEGDDTLAGFGGDDLIEGGGGDDVFTYSSLNLGGLPDDVINNDTLLGGETGETTGDTLDTTTLNDAVTLTYTGAESGTISDGVSTASFSEIEFVRLGSANDTVIGSVEGEVVDAGGGADILTLGGGNDTIVATYLGSDTIDGEGGIDTYLGDGFAGINVQVDLSGDGSVAKSVTLTPTPGFPDVTDTITSVESFVGGVGGRDILTLTEEVGLSDIAGLPADSAGSFFPTGGGGGRPFGPTELYSFSDILNGTSPDGILPAIGPAGTYTVAASDLDGEIAGIRYDNFESISFTIAGPSPDGVVDGADTGELMELGYTDAQGDQITDGSDSILGNGGNDTIFGGRGDDTIRGGEGDDVILPSAETSGSFFAEFDGGAGNDTVLLTSDTYELDTSTFVDFETLELARTSGDMEVILSTDGLLSFDTVVATADRAGFVDQFSIQVGSAESVDFSSIIFDGFVVGEDFTRIVALDEATSENVVGTRLNDFMFSLGGGDILSGGSGNDAFFSFGTATLDGGIGTDGYSAVSYDSLSVMVDNAGDGTATKDFGGTITTDALTSIEAYVADEDGAEVDVITLSTAVLDTDVATAITGLSDSAVGSFTDAGGTVTPFGPSEAVQLSGILDGSAGVGPVGSYQITAGDEDGQIGEISFEAFETINFTVISSVNGVVDGSDDAQVMDLSFVDADGDSITDGPDSILGNGGADTITSGGGNDTIDGGDGGDRIIAGDGADQVDGGAGADFIYTSGPVSLDPRDPVGKPDQDYPGIFVADDDRNNDRDSVDGGIGNDTIITGDDDDTITAGLGDDVVDAGVDDDDVDGGEGNDFIEGGEGNDTIEGGIGDDTIYGGVEGFDVLNIPDNAGDLRPDNGDDSIDGGAGNDLIFGQDDSDTIKGGEGNDTLDGGVDADSIMGDDGDDEITGGQGADTLEGGDGRDIFRFGSVSDADGDQIDGGDGDGSTADFDRLDLRGLGDFRIVNDTLDADGNSTSGTVEFLDSLGGVTGSFDFTEIEKIICFTPGTRIITQAGYVPIENLRAGDRVMTRDNGFQNIAWIGKRALSAQDLRTCPKLRPILIRRGALGPDLPDRDMMVSPNHRMLQMGGQVELHFGEAEVLTAAKHMTHYDGVETAQVGQTTYYHMMFDCHQIVMADGCWTESFYPGDEAIDATSQAQRDEIFQLFPELRTAEGRTRFETARSTLKRFEAALI